MTDRDSRAHARGRMRHLGEWTCAEEAVECRAVFARVFALLLGVVLLISATGQVVLASPEAAGPAATLVVDDVPDVDTPVAPEAAAWPVPVHPAPVSIDAPHGAGRGRMHTDLILRPPRCSWLVAR